MSWLLNSSTISIIYTSLSSNQFSQLMIRTAKSSQRTHMKFLRTILVLTGSYQISRVSSSAILSIRVRSDTWCSDRPRTWSLVSTISWRYTTETQIRHQWTWCSFPIVSNIWRELQESYDSNAVTLCLSVLVAQVVVLWRNSLPHSSLFHSVWRPTRSKSRRITWRRIGMRI